jgi:hypothetical protein
MSGAGTAGSGARARVAIFFDPDQGPHGFCLHDWLSGVWGNRGVNQDQSPTYPLKCPVCGTSMVGEKSDPEAKDFDLHCCLNCGAVVRTSQESDVDDQR